MITVTHRPNTFDEVVGQDLNVKLLKAIVRRPEEAPKSIVLGGEFGCGKTTMARIFARALNCTSSRSKPCGECENCKTDINSVSWYSEYDATVVGNVDKIRELRDTFYYHSDGYKVIVFDEIHAASRSAQTALLKVVEEAPPRTFFIFATTDVDKIIPTIRSRSLELRVATVPEEPMTERLKAISADLDQQVPDEIYHLICRKSEGHMRNACMLLDQYFMVGDTQFRESVRTSRTYFLQYFMSIARCSKEQCFNAVDNLLTFPVADLKEDFQDILLALVSTLVGYSTPDPEVSEVVKALGVDIIRIYKNCVTDWVITSFTSDEYVKATLLSLWQLFVSARVQQKR